MITEVDTNINCANKAHEDQALLVQAHELVSICRPSFKKICKDKCMAELLNHFLYWISWKNKDQPKSVIQSGMRTYYATTNELAEHIDWSEKKVRLSVNALVELGIIGLTHSQKYKMDRTKHFFFGRDQYIKLIELCAKNSICLAHIGLPTEIIQMLSAFSETVHCPCLKQTVNLPNASGKNDHMQTVKMPNASGKNDHVETKITNKDSNLDIDKERKNRERQQNVDSDKHSHPSIQTSQKFSAEEKTTQKEKVTLTEQEEQAFEIAKLLKLARLKKDAKNKEHCAKMVENDILTHEKMKSLKEYSFEKLRQLKGDNVELYLGNLAGDVEGWLQAEEAKRRSASTDIFGNSNSPRPSVLVSEETVSEEVCTPDATQETAIEEIVIEISEPDATQCDIDEISLPETTQESAQVVESVNAVETVEDTEDVPDDQLVKRMLSLCQAYRAENRIQECLDVLADIRDIYGLYNAELLHYMKKSHGWTLQAFFEKLQANLERDFCQVAAAI